jgi:hypothetical protein
VYHGAGRYYDPQLGLRLQPSPAGGPPTLPQALNRYAVSPAQSVVGQAAQHIDRLTVTAWKGLGKTILTTITDPARQGTLNVVIQSLLAGAIGRSRPTGMTFVQLMGEPEAFTGAFAGLELLRSDTYPLPPQGCVRGFFRWLLRRPTTVQIDIREGLVASEALDELPKNLGLISSETQFASPGWVQMASKYLGTFAWGGALSGAVQYLSDYRNPYLTPGQIGRRTGIAFVGGGFTAVGGAWLGTKLGIAGGPWGMALGFTLGFIYFGYIQPQIFQWTGQSPQRNLAPLGSP